MRRYSITSRLVLIAVIPAIIMFVAISVALYVIAVQDVGREIEERGQLIAHAVAESAQYGVISGNKSDLENVVSRIFRVDQNVVSIEVYSEPYTLLAKSPSRTSAAYKAFRTDVYTDQLNLNLFDAEGEAPHAVSDKLAAPASHQGKAVGHVVVTMTKDVLLTARLKLIAMGCIVIFATALISASVGAFYSKRLQKPLAAVLGALRSIQAGAFDVQFDGREQGEVLEVQKAIVGMADSLKTHRQRLEDTVTARTGELEDAIATNRRLLAHNDNAIEDERKRIALEIHDQLNASLTAISLQAQALTARADEMPGDTAAIAYSIAKTADDLYSAARRIVKSIRPEILDTLGLRGALTEMVRQLDEIHDTCSFDLTYPRDCPSLSPALSITVYRVVQEALSNVVKHAHAKHASVRVQKDTQRNALHLVVSDDGNGFDKAAGNSVGFGLVSMRERARTAGGSLHIATSIKGTRIEAFIPLDVGPHKAQTA